jgi:hypothetical protein
MATTIDDIIDRPYMLNHFTVNAQRLSAILPPDDWDPKTHKPARIQRQPSGIFVLVSDVAHSETGEEDRLIPDTAKPSKCGQESAEDAAKSHVGGSSCWTHVRRWLHWCFGGRRDEG